MYSNVLIGIINKEISRIGNKLDIYKKIFFFIFLSIPCGVVDKVVAVLCDKQGIILLSLDSTRKVLDEVGFTTENLN